MRTSCKPPLKFVTARHFWTFAASTRRTLCTPGGKVGHELSEEEGYAAAKSAAYGMASRRRVRELPAALQSDNGGR